MFAPPPVLEAPGALALAGLWGVRPRRATHLGSGENASWRIRSADGDFVLRLTGEAHRSADQIEAELDFVEHLADGGLRVARPQRTPAGERVVDASARVPGNARSFAALFSYLHGRHFAYHSDDVDAPLFRAWGTAMGRVHALSASFRSREGVERAQWFDDPVAGCLVAERAPEAHVLALRGRLLRWLRALPPDPARYGLVHGDCERTNLVLADDGSLQILDFDDCCRHWFVWDVACALWAFRNAPREDRGRFLGWFLEGYAAAYPPDTERLASFSDLVRLRTIALLLRRLQDPAQSRAWVEGTQDWLRSPWSW